MYPWESWLAAWTKCNRPLDEFWRMTPCQSLFVLEANGMVQRKQGTRSLLAAFGGMGLPADALVGP